MAFLLALALLGAGQEITTFHQPPPSPNSTEAAPATPVTAPAPAGGAPPSAPNSLETPTAENPAVMAPVVTPSAPAGPVLWRNISSGMSVSELRTLYPQGHGVSHKNDRTVLSDVPVIEGCEAKVNIMHPAGVVKEIVMRGEGSLAGRCSLKIITALSGKYGESLEKDKVHGSILAREGKNYVWMRDGITLQFKRYTQGAFGGGGLFAASWELRYSANAVAIDL